MRKRKTRISKSVLLSSLLLAGLIFLLLPNKLTEKFHDAFYHFFGPVLSIGSDLNVRNLPMIFDSNSVVSIEKYQKLQQENEKLKIANKKQLIQMHELHMQLEKALGMKSRFPDVSPAQIIADVIKISLGPYDRELLIDRGKRDGVETGQCVIGENYVIGTVSETFNYNAKVRLLSDPDHKIIVTLEAEKVYVRAIMEGAGNNKGIIKGVPTEHKIVENSMVYASKLAGFLNTAIPLGHVSIIEHDDKDPLFWVIEVETIYDHTKPDYVTVVVTDPENTEIE